MLSRNANAKIDALRARFGLSLVVGALCFLLMMVLDRSFGVISIDEVALADSGVRAALFGALIGVCGLFLTVMLGVLAVVTSMGDDRPVVKLMKEQMHIYDELIHRLVGPIFIVLVVGLASVVCLLLPSADAKAPLVDRGWLLTAIPALTLSLAVGLFFQTASVGRLMGRVLLFRERGPTGDDTATAARERIETRRRNASEEREPGGAAAVSVG